MKIAILLCCALVAAVSAEIFFEETFGAGWEDRWTKSTFKGSDAGDFVLSAGKYFNNAETDKGLKTSQDAKFYGISAPFATFSNKDKKLIIQFRVKHEQNIDCGGGYVKVFPSGLEGAKMHGDSVYNIMFGPDICGPGTRKVHVIFAYKGNNLLTKKSITCKTDEMSHLYTLIVNPDNTYEVRVDGNKEESGSLYDDFDFLKPKMINDPAQSKPKDWVDKKKIDDVTDVKPEGYDKPAQIADPEATKPEDWDDEMDGEWEAPMIDNPEYKGEWKPRQIDNPDYKGEWVHPQIANPEYVNDPSVYLYEDNAAIGIDVWQVKSGSIFDDILITDDLATAESRASSFKELAAGEEKAKKDAEAAAKPVDTPAAEEDEDEEDGDEVEGHDEF
jgi:calreticulin